MREIREKDFEMFLEGVGIPRRYVDGKATKESKIPKEQKVKLISNFGVLKAGTFLGGEAKGLFTLMPDIFKVSVIGNDRPVVKVDFADDTFEKAILSKEDEFSLEQGVSICITKKLLSVICGYSEYGSVLYNKVIKRALDVYENDKKTEEAYQLYQKEEEKRLKKLEEKRKKRREKMEQKRIAAEEAERERQIEIQKEAYLRAMKEFEIEKIKRLKNDIRNG